MVVIDALVSCGGAGDDTHAQETGRWPNDWVRNSHQFLQCGEQVISRLRQGHVCKSSRPFSPRCSTSSASTAISTPEASSMPVVLPHALSGGNSARPEPGNQRNSRPARFLSYATRRCLQLLDVHR